jgi:uncharacterized RmlC-like cupin family protein
MEGVMAYTPSWLVREGDVPGYHPANHVGTTNHRLIGPDTVGSRQVEVVLGVIEKNQGALPHAHPGIEQVCYLLSGSARAQVGDEAADMQAGDCCYFPPDIPHVFTVTSDAPARLLVIYTPPYEESPDRVIR